MPFNISVDGKVHEIEIVARRPALVLSIDGRMHTVSQEGRAIFVDGVAMIIPHVFDGDRHFLHHAHRTIEAVLVDPRQALESASGGANEVRAPMPGAIVSLAKAVGDTVRRGETIVTIESMKLQTALVAPRDGVVAEIARGEGETFEKDEVLVRLAEAGQD